MRQTAATRYAIGCAMVLVASRAAAQGTLGAQGFGYPPGQLSAYSRSLGGATGETDPLSPINPASLMLMQRGGLYLQSEQESRSIDAGGSTGSTRAYRFPLFSAVLPPESFEITGPKSDGAAEEAEDEPEEEDSDSGEETAAEHQGQHDREQEREPDGCVRDHRLEDAAAWEKFYGSAHAGTWLLWPACPACSERTLCMSLGDMRHTVERQLQGLALDEVGPQHEKPA